MQDATPIAAATDRRRRTALAVGGGALAILVAVATVATRGAPAPSAPPDAGGVVPPIDPVAWQDIAWAEVPDPGNVMGGPLGQRVDRIVAGGPGLVAIGAAARGQVGAEESFGAVWLSATGRDWIRLELNAGVPAGDTASPAMLAADPNGIVIWGSVCCAVESAAAWWSADGSLWERLHCRSGSGPKRT